MDTFYFLDPSNNFNSVNITFLKFLSGDPPIMNNLEVTERHDFFFNMVTNNKILM